MEKKAQIPNQYEYGAYEPQLDSMQLLPGDVPQVQEQTPDWMFPVGLAAAGLTGYGLLRGARRGLKNIFNRMKQTKVPTPVANRAFSNVTAEELAAAERAAAKPFSWEEAMKERGLQSTLGGEGSYLGQGFGSSYKGASVNTLLKLGKIARS